MTAARITQQVLQLSAQHDPSARVSQQALLVAIRQKPPVAGRKPVLLQTAATASPGIAGDPHWQKVELLLNAEHGVRDCGPRRRALSADKRVGPLLSADAPKFDRSLFMGRYAGSTDIRAFVGFTAAPDPVGYDLGAEPFTVEVWVKAGLEAGLRGIVGCYETRIPDRGWRLILQDNVFRFQASVDNTGADLDVAGITLAADRWTHVCVERDKAGKVRMYFDGAMVASGSFPARIRRTAQPLEIMGTDRLLTTGLNGHLDNLRITRGVARYASDDGFAPPAAPYPMPPLPAPADRSSDPYWDLVSLLITSEEQTLIDVSPRQAAITGTATRTTTGSFYYGEVVQHFELQPPITIADVDNQFDLGNGPFTFEWFGVNNTSLGSFALLTVADQWQFQITPSAWSFQRWTGSAWSIVVEYSETQWGLATPVVVTRDEAATVRLYVGGVLRAEALGVDFRPLSAPPVLTITRSPANNFRMGELRITKGVARWTGDYAVDPDSHVFRPPKSGPPYMPVPPPEIAYPYALPVANPKAKTEDMSPWAVVAGSAPNRVSRYRGGPADMPAPDGQYYLGMGTSVRSRVYQQFKLPEAMWDDVDAGGLNLVITARRAGKPDNLDDSCLYAEACSDAETLAMRFGRNVSVEDWFDERLELELPPGTRWVRLGFFSFRENASAWSSSYAFDIRATIVEDATPRVWLAQPSFPLVAAEWTTKIADTLTTLAGAGVARQFGLDGIRTDSGGSGSCNFYFPATVPAEWHADVDAGLVAIRFSCLSILSVTGDTNDSGNVYLEFVDGTGETLGLVWDQASPYPIRTGGEGREIHTPVPAGTRAVRYGVRGNKDAFEAVNGIVDFYPVFPLALLSRPATLPEAPPAPPVIEYDPHWSRVRLLLSARNGAVENLASQPASLTVSGSVQAAAGESPFADGYSLEVNPAGAAERSHFVTAALGGAAFAREFTLEAWLRKNGRNPQANMGWLNVLNGFFDSAANPAAAAGTGSGLMADAALPHREWFHWAVTRDEAGVMRMFINGKLQARQSNPITTAFPLTVEIGRGGTLISSHCSWWGQIDELRITDGVVRYTEDFVPPASRHPLAAEPWEPSGPGHRYWRVYIHDHNGDSSFLVVGELEFAGEPGGLDLTGGGTALASSTSSDSSPENAFNDTFDTGSTYVAGRYWSAVSGDVRDVWLGYDFGEGVEPDIVEVRMLCDRHATRAPRDFSIQYSDDGMNWKTAWIVTDQTGWAIGQWRTFAKPATEPVINAVMTRTAANARITGSGWLPLPFISTPVYREGDWETLDGITVPDGVPRVVIEASVAATSSSSTTTSAGMDLRVTINGAAVPQGYTLPRSSATGFTNNITHLATPPLDVAPGDVIRLEARKYFSTGHDIQATTNTWISVRAID
mgnify:CR=1 FL=1